MILESSTMLARRWFATIVHDVEHKLYLAVSTTSDPMKSWKGVLTPFESPDFGFRMGVDKNGFYGCWWNHHRDVHTMMTACAIPKEDLIATGGPNLARVQLFKDLEIESFPATDLDPIRLRMRLIGSIANLEIRLKMNM